MKKNPNSLHKKKSQKKDPGGLTLKTSSGFNLKLLNFTFLYIFGKTLD